MPPKQDEFLLSPPSPSLSARLVSIEDKRVEETSLESSNKDSLTAHFEASALRASRLAYLLEQEAGDGIVSPSVAACKSSLLSKFSTVLDQTSLLVDSWRASSDSSDRMVAKMRSIFGLHRMDQYLDKIELTMLCVPQRKILDERLGEFIGSLRIQGKELHKDAQTNYECCVSPLHGASSLFFDLAVGPTVSTKVDSSKTCPLPLEAEIQPMIELRAEDLIQGRVNKEDVRAYSIEIESCKHYAQHFHSSTGWTGEACIRLRLRSSLCAENKESRPQEWNYSTLEEDMIPVKEVTV